MELSSIADTNLNTLSPTTVVSADGDNGKPTSSPIVHYIYNESIEGFKVSIDLTPEEKGDSLLLAGPAIMRFVGITSSFSLNFDYLILYAFPDLPVRIKTSADTTLFPRFIHRPKGEYLFDKNPFYFADMDYDGEKELVVVRHLWGPRGAIGYQVFNTDGTERTDKPISMIDSQTTFNPKAKTITLNYYHGVIIGSTALQYSKTSDGRFALTDSTQIFHRINGNTITDSLRMHYQPINGEMVLIKTEVL